MSQPDAAEAHAGSSPATDAAEAHAGSSPATDAAADLDAIRRRMLNVIGHELRTPVTTVHGLAAQACAATDPTVVIDEICPAILRNAERLTVLLDDLLVASGITTAIPVDPPQPVDLGPLLAEMWTASGAPDPLSVAGPSVTVLVSPPPLRRALEAILDNAAAYGSAPPEVDVDVHDGSVTITVASPGEALHPEEVRLATEPFFRGERAVTTRPGLGVGLSIARELLTHLGGSLHVRASATGTLTTIVLPLEAG